MSMHGPWSKRKKKREGKLWNENVMSMMVAVYICCMHIHRHPDTSKISLLCVAMATTIGEPLGCYSSSTPSTGGVDCVSASRISFASPSLILKEGERDYLFGRPILSLPFFSLSLFFPILSKHRRRSTGRDKKTSKSLTC